MGYEMSKILVKRNAETIIMDTLADTPVTVLQGARQVGKNTLAIIVTKDRISKSVTFDSETSLASAKENALEFVEQLPEGLLIINEIQKCPELLNAIKMAVDRNRRPGRFLITGSANILN